MKPLWFCFVSIILRLIYLNLAAILYSSTKNIQFFDTREVFCVGKFVDFLGKFRKFSGIWYVFDLVQIVNVWLVKPLKSTDENIYIFDCYYIFIEKKFPLLILTNWSKFQIHLENIKKKWGVVGVEIKISCPQNRQSINSAVQTKEIIDAKSYCYHKIHRKLITILYFSVRFWISDLNFTAKWEIWKVCIEWTVTTLTKAHRINVHTP